MQPSRQQEHTGDAGGVVIGAGMDVLHAVALVDVAAPEVIVMRADDDQLIGKVADARDEGADVARLHGWVARVLDGHVVALVGGEAEGLEPGAVVEGGLQAGAVEVEGDIGFGVGDAARAGQPSFKEGIGQRRDVLVVEAHLRRHTLQGVGDGGADVGRRGGTGREHERHGEHEGQWAHGASIRGRTGGGRMSRLRHKPRAWRHGGGGGVRSWVTDHTHPCKERNRVMADGTKHKAFAAGMASGGMVFLLGMLLGGAGPSDRDDWGNWRGRAPSERPGAHDHERGGYEEGVFDVLKARRIELVDRDGRPLMQINPNEEGAVLTMLDEQGDRRVRLSSDGLVAVYDEQGRLRARMVAETENTPWTGGQVATFNTRGQASARLSE